MAVLHVKSPNGTTKSINLDTMNIEVKHASTDTTTDPNGYCLLPNGLLIQWLTSEWTQYLPGYVGEISISGSYSLSFSEDCGVIGVITIGERDSGALWITHYRSSSNGFVGNMYSATTFYKASFNHIVIGAPAS